MNTIKKMTMLVAMLVFTASWAQWGGADSDNVFEQSENQQYQTNGEVAGGGGDGLGGTDPDPVPINDYLPFLAVAGAALAVYALRRKQVAA